MGREIVSRFICWAPNQKNEIKIEKKKRADSNPQLREKENVGTWLIRIITFLGKHQVIQGTFLSVFFARSLLKQTYLDTNKLHWTNSDAEASAKAG